MKPDEETRRDDRYSTPVAPVGGISGRSLPRSGLIAIVPIVVAAGSFLFGTQVGDSPRVLQASQGTAAPRTASAMPIGVPPASTASFERALASARAAFLGSSSQIVAAKVMRYGELSRSTGVSADDWVWVFIARGTFSFASCGGRLASPRPCLSPATTARVIVDFGTGAFVEVDVPAYP